LSVGAPVMLLGLPGGQVTDVGLDIDPTTLVLRGRVEIVAYPERLVARLQTAAAGQELVRASRHAIRPVDDGGPGFGPSGGGP
jgi:paraquat-inducible protein B